MKTNHVYTEEEFIELMILIKFLGKKKGISKYSEKNNLPLNSVTNFVNTRNTKKEKWLNEYNATNTPISIVISDKRNYHSYTKEECRELSVLVKYLGLVVGTKLFGDTYHVAYKSAMSKYYHYKKHGVPSRSVWNKKEKDYLLETVKTHRPKEAICLCADKFGRTTEAVRKMYYKNLRQPGICNARRWTEEEIKELLALIESHPNNFRQAFRIHGQKYNRSIAACEQYYEKYRKSPDAKTCMITVGGKKHASPNRKNIYEGTGGTVEDVRPSIWKRILAFFGL